jgi:hypothetical protein
MKICISKYILGTEKNLIFDPSDKLFSWTDTAPKDVWFYGNAPDHDRSLNDLCLLFNLTPKSSPPEKYIRSFTELGHPGALSVPWHLVLPHDEFQKYITNLLEDLQSALEAINDTTYCEKFLSNRNALTNLCDSYIDKSALQNYIRKEVNPSLISTLKSFIPTDTGYLKKPVYQQGSTGRTIVKRGPKILTLKKAHRSIIQSRFKAGKIVQLDYSSLEPRIMLGLAGKKMTGDIYDEIAKTSGLKLERAKLKMAVMGALYGISPLKLQGMLPRTVDASEILDKIKQMFGISALGNRLRREYEAKGKIMNYYGRPLYFSRSDNHLLVSHYVQSTGVDVCLSGFSSIIKKINDEKMRSVPIFLIHDALLLDVPADELDKLNDLKAHGSKVEKFDLDFPLSIGNAMGESFDPVL